MILSATSGERLDGLCMQGVAYLFAVASEICEAGIRMTARPASLSRNAWDVGDRRHDLGVITGGRRRGADDERDAVPVHDESLLCTGFRAVNRAGASGVTAAECANHDAVEDRQLGFNDAGHRSSVRRCIWRSFPTPASFHRRSRR